MIKNRLKLSTQLSLCIMLMAAPIFMFSLGILYYHSRILIHQEVAKYSMNMLNTTMHRVRTFMGTIETAANTNTWMVEQNFRPDSLLSISRRIVRLNRHVNGCSITAEPDMFPEAGRYFSAYTIRQRLDGDGRGDTIITQREAEYDYNEQVWYKTPRKLEKACWVDPFNDYNEGTLYTTELIASYCKPVYQDGKIAGILSTDLSFRRLAEIINESKSTYPHAYYMLLGGDGRYLVHPDTTRLFKKTIFTDTDPTNDKDIITMGYEMTAGNQGFIHIHHDGKYYHVCYMPVPGTNWSLAMVCPDSDAMKSYYGLGGLIVVLLVVGLLVILAFCYHAVKQLVTPVNNLIDTTRQIADGHYDTTIPTTASNDVLGKLQNCFALMQQSLSKRMGSLQQRADELRRHNEALNDTNIRTEGLVQRKSQFIQYMTQQMRMPLNVIMGFAYVLRESSTDDNVISEDELTSITGMMKKNVVDMNRMILLLYDATETDTTGALSRHRVDEVSCNTLARECMAHVQSHYPQAVLQFDSSLTDGFCLLTNRFYLMNILRELLYNAVRHSYGKDILLSVTQTETTVRFTVQDVGPGMLAHLPDLTFTPFATSDQRPSSSGIGLALVRRHALALGGSMTIDTTYRAGCRVTIELPQ